MSSITRPDTPTQSISEAQRYWHAAARARFTLRAVGSIPLKWVAAPAAGALLTPLALVGPTPGGREPNRDAGLTVTIRLPAAPTGRALSVLSYGATPGRNPDAASAAFPQGD